MSRPIDVFRWVDDDGQDMATITVDGRWIEFPSDMLVLLLDEFTLAAPA